MVDNKIVIGVDIGGTNIRAGVMKDDGDVLKIIHDKTPKSKKDIINKIRSMIDVLNFKEISAIGIGIAGPIDQKSGKIYPPNIPSLNGVNIPKQFSKYNVPVYIDNDSNCFLYGELIYGSARGYSNVLGVTIGTGIGCGILCDGKIYRGRDGSAGEVGHIVLNNNKTFENLVSGTALDIEIKNKYGNDTDIEKIFANKNFKSFYKEVCHNMGIGFASLVNIFNPEIIVVGGYLSKYYPKFKKDVYSTISKYSISPSKKVKFVKHKLIEPGVIGAGLFALEHAKKPKKNLKR